MTDTDQSGITLPLSDAESIVLFDLLSRTRRGDGPIAPDAAERHALNALCCALESALAAPFKPDYTLSVERAKRALLEKYGK